MASYIDQFSEESILVIKKPPVSAPTIVAFKAAGENNFMEDRFLCFAYRYQYVNDEFSATSQFSEPAFVSGSFSFGFNSFLNEGMLNTASAVNITYNTGSNLVTGIELLFKEMGDSTIKIIESLDKAERGLGNNNDEVYLFDNQKIFTVLPEYEILRLYDNVPLIAKAQTLMGNRLIYGNYREGYDLVDRFSTPIDFSFFTNLVSEAISETVIEPVRQNGNYNINGNIDISNSIISIPIDSSKLLIGSSINITITIRHSEFTGQTPFPVETTGNTDIEFIYVLQQSFASVFALATNADFVAKVGTIANIQTVANSCTGVTFTDNFNCSLPAQLDAYNKCASGISAINQPIEIISSPSSSSLGFQFPAMQYADDCAVQTQTFYEYYTIVVDDVALFSDSNNYSLHSNRGYEVGIVYMDNFNRATTAQISSNNTTHIPCGSSDKKNELFVTIPGGGAGEAFQAAPFWATRYKFVIKPDKSEYNTIYSNIIFQDPLSNAAYFLLEGENAKKIEEGDRLIVKRDASGPMIPCTYTTVLEKQAQSKNFIVIDSPLDPGTPIEIASGVYMKINPNNFDTTALDDAGGNVVAPGREYSQTKRRDRFPKIFYPVNVLNPGGTGATSFVDYTVPSGSQMKLYFFQHRQGNGRSVETIRNEVEFTVIASKDYSDFKEAWDGENIGALLDLNQTLPVEPGPRPDGSNVISNSYDNTLVTLGRPPEGGDLPQGQYTFYYQFFRNSATNEFYLGVSGPRGAGNSSTRIARLTVTIEVVRADASVVFETLPQDALADVWYENDLSFSIDNLGNHSGNVQDQIINFQNAGAVTPQDGIVNTGFSNCITFGNGVESYKIRDSINGKPFRFGNRVTSTSAQIYKESNRFADLTYSGIFNDESNVNKLNEFNLGLLNYKPLEDSFGPIEKLSGRRDDILTLQEDKISYVLVGKDLLTDAAGGGALTSVPTVLGKQVARSEKYGISNNPESFVVWGADTFFTDSKRGVVINLKGSAASNDRLLVISQAGMRGWFRDFFIQAIGRQILGGYDPYMNEFVLASNSDNTPRDNACRPCGVTENVFVTPGVESIYCVNLAQAVGQVTIEYIIPNAVEDGVITEINTPTGAGQQPMETEDGRLITAQETLTGVGYSITAIYNEVAYTTGVVYISGTLTFNKNIVNVSDVTIIITTTSTLSDTLEVTTSCPTQTILNIYNIALTSNNEAGQYIHNEYSWIDASYSSPLHSNQVTFLSSSANPIISQFVSLSGPLGSGVIPDSNSTVSIISNRLAQDNFVFDINTNKFMYLRTDTNFKNNAADINTLIGASTRAIPIVGGITRNYANFTMPSSGSNLYLIWDYRKPTAIYLNQGVDAFTACCSTIIATPINCGQQQGGGYGYPIVYKVALGILTGDVILHFDGGIEPVRFVLEFDGVNQADTGYRGDANQQGTLNQALADLNQASATIQGPGPGTATFPKSTATAEAKLSIYAPITSSSWTVTVDCPD